MNEPVLSDRQRGAIHGAALAAFTHGATLVQVSDEVHDEVVAAWREDAEQRADERAAREGER